MTYSLATGRGYSVNAKLAKALRKTGLPKKDQRLANQLPQDMKAKIRQDITKAAQEHRLRNEQDQTLSRL